jgi:hypothetical protein
LHGVNVFQVAILVEDVADSHRHPLAVKLLALFARGMAS